MIFRTKSNNSNNKASSYSVVQDEEWSMESTVSVGETTHSISTPSHKPLAPSFCPPPPPPIKSAFAKSSSKRKSSSSKNKQAFSKSSSRKPIQRKSVSFEEAENKCYFVEQRCDLEKYAQQLWYNTEDFEEMKERLRRQVLQVKVRIMEQEQQKGKEKSSKSSTNTKKEIAMKKTRKNKNSKDGEDAETKSTASGASSSSSATTLNFIKTLEIMLGKVQEINFVLDDANRLVASSSSIKQQQQLQLQQQQHSFLIPKKALHRLYNKMAGGSLEYIGLEQYLSQELCLDAKERRESLQDIIADIQSEQERGLWENGNESSGGGSASTSLEQEFADCCRQVSQAHALMAQLLAGAQYQAQS